MAEELTELRTSFKVATKQLQDKLHSAEQVSKGLYPCHVICPHTSQSRLHDKLHTYIGRAHTHTLTHTRTRCAMNRYTNMPSTHTRACNAHGCGGAMAMGDQWVRVCVCMCVGEA